jgi:hypothetical protein
MDVDVDVRSIPDAIHVPTVVMHRSEDAPDARIAHDAPTARYIVDNVPQATAVDIGPTGRLDRIPSVLEDFLPGAWQEREQSLAHGRVLATVLFTDLVDSTEKAVQYALDGTNSSANITRRSAGNSRALAAVRSTPPEMASSPPASMGRRGRFAVHARSAMRRR